MNDWQRGSGKHGSDPRSRGIATVACIPDHTSRTSMTSESQSSRLTEQILRLVRTQVAMDDGLSMPGIRPFIPKHLTTENEQAISGAALARHLLPFLSLNGAREEPGRAPLARVLGASWKWKQPYRDSPEDVINFLTDERRAVPGTEECAELFLVEPLDLYVAHEGKNRVRFLRDAGLEFMPAAITTVPYPAPHRISLFRADVLHQSELWAVLDGDCLTRVSMPELTVPLLTAYGVAPPARWPSDWPDPVDVATALAGPTQLSNLCRTIDLRPLFLAMKAAERNGESVAAAITDIEILKPRWRRIALIFAVWLVLMAIASQLPERLGVPVLALLTGTSVGALAGAGAKLFRTKRLYVR